MSLNKKIFFSFFIFYFLVGAAILPSITGFNTEFNQNKCNESSFFIHRKSADTMPIYDFVIITPSIFADELIPLKNHKENLGFSTYIKTTEDIYSEYSGVDHQEQIKYFIKDAIEQWGIWYVLLLGNESFIPVRYSHLDDGVESSFSSDLYYADVFSIDEYGNLVFEDWDSNGNGIFAEWTSTSKDKLDLYPDVYLGRIPCNNIIDVIISVEKIILYETNEPYDWFTNVLLCGGDTCISEDPYNEGENINEEIASILGNDLFAFERLWASNGNLSVANINNVINNGVGLIDFSGLGDFDKWMTHPHNDSETHIPQGGYTKEDVLNLSNDDMLPVIMLGGGHCADIGCGDSSISDAFLFHQNGGGIGVFGSTANTYYYCRDHSCDGLFGWIEKRLFDNYENMPLVTLGRLWISTITDYINNFPVMSDEMDCKTVEEFILLGDPTLNVEHLSSNHCPNKPCDPIPEDGQNGIILNPSLAVYATDVDDDEMTIRFYDATTDKLIGSDQCNNGSIASTIWSGLSPNTTYSWYAVADDGECMNFSDTWSFTTYSLNRVHNVDTGEDFDFIQDAIDDADTLKGHTILVDAGVYYENVVVDKSLTLIGEDKNTTIIDGMKNGDVLTVNTCGVHINDFTIQHSGVDNRHDNAVRIEGDDCCFKNNLVKDNSGALIVSDCVNCTIDNNIYYNNTQDIIFDTVNNSSFTKNKVYNCCTMHFYTSNYNAMKYNQITNTSGGLYITSSSHNLFLKNSLSDNGKGSYAGFGILLEEFSCYNIIESNRICNNRDDGIWIYSDSNNNSILKNYISSNFRGVLFGRDVVDNKVFHNDFYNNSQCNGRDFGANDWDNGYPSGGNYWDDYTGNDMDGDGIGDTPYDISGGENKDRYPLMEPFEQIESKIIMDDICIPRGSNQSSGYLKAVNMTENVGSGEWTIHYDPSVIEVISVSNGDFEFIAWYDDENGCLTMNTWNTGSNVSGNFTIAEITFATLQCPICHSPINIVNSTLFTDVPSPDKINHDTINGSLCCCCHCVIGDMNGDCSLNSADIRYLALYLCGDPEYQLLCAPGDVNSDGEENSADIRYLALNLCGDPDYSPLYP